MNIARIDAQATYAIRHQILRPSEPIEACAYPGDFDDETFHLGTYAGAHAKEKLVGIASYYLESHKAFQDQVQFRLRGMATLPEARGQGFGAALIDSAVSILKQNQATLLWCNARLSAVPFYKKLGFEIHGDLFEIANIGPHYVMYKRI